MGIDGYVLCRRRACNLPEIDMTVNKNGNVVAKCRACGWHGKLDNDHKLASYISKNQPWVAFDSGSEDANSDAGEEEEQEEEELSYDDESISGVVSVIAGFVNDK